MVYCVTYVTGLSLCFQYQRESNNPPEDDMDELLRNAQDAELQRQTAAAEQDRDFYGTTL